MGWILAVLVVLTIASLLTAYHFYGLHESAQSAIDALRNGLTETQELAGRYNSNWTAEMAMSGKLSAENNDLKKQLEAAQAQRSDLIAPIRAQVGSHGSVNGGKSISSGVTLKTSDVLNAGKLTPKKLRQFREQHGITQVALAKALRWEGLKTGSCLISNYENGHQGLTQWRIADIEKYMKQRGFKL